MKTALLRHDHEYRRHFRGQPSLVDRFWKYVLVDDGCWIWIGATIPGGYGGISFRQRSIIAHRLSFLIFNGDFDRSLDVLHRCDNPPCVRPDHLFLGTHADNMADASRKGRMRGVPGEAHYKAKLTVEAVREIRSSSLSRTDLARRFGVSTSAIGEVRSRRNWGHVQ